MLFARSKLEFDEWVRLFQTIIEMKAAGVSITDENPYDYLQRVSQTEAVQRTHKSIDKSSPTAFHENENNRINEEEEKVA